MEKLYDNKKKCYGCGACAAVCPAGAVSMERDPEGFPYPVADPVRCTDCGKCKEVCPVGKTLEPRKGKVYAVRCKDTWVLENSTSGGAFSLLAQEIADQGGLVCGAVFGADFSVKHTLSREFAPMRKSKYAQSDMESCYGIIGAALGEGKTVLFTGTPCQCHALKCFLPEDYQGLFLLSLVCRGVLSPGLWEDYTAWLSKDRKLEAYDFRDKRQRNDGHAVSYVLDGAETVVPMDRDRLSQMYNRGLISRPSCYACPYCRPDQDFDFTIGDFWGIEREHPDLADGLGTSLLIVRSQKGEALLRHAARKARIVPCGDSAALQPALVKPAEEPFLRKFLFRDYAGKTDGDNTIAYIVKKYSVG